MFLFRHKKEGVKMSESNNNIPMRITQLEEAETFDYDSYLAEAKAGSGTKKSKVRRFLLNSSI
jgi:hypothetical protein